MDLPFDIERKIRNTTMPTSVHQVPLQADQEITLKSPSTNCEVVPTHRYKDRSTMKLVMLILYVLMFGLILIAIKFLVRKLKKMYTPTRISSKSNSPRTSAFPSQHWTIPTVPTSLNSTTPFYSPPLPFRHAVVVSSEGRGETRHNLIFHSHEPLTLAQTAVRSFADASLTQHQKQALQMLKASIDKWNSECISSEIGVPRPFYMRTLIRYFSEIFFLRGLNNVEFNWANMGKYSPDNANFCYGTAGYREGHLTEITMSTQYEGDLNHVEWQAHLIGTLLHECVHAFLTTYCCSSHVRNCEDEACRARAWQHTGLTSHGDSWLKLAWNVQAQARKHLRIEVDLNILRSTEYEKHAREEELRSRSRSQHH